MSGAVDHPCLSCQLPDCDETDRRCNLRQALADYGRARRRREISAPVRASYAIAYQELYGQGRNERRKASRESANV